MKYINPILDMTMAAEDMRIQSYKCSYPRVVSESVPLSQPFYQMSHAQREITSKLIYTVHYHWHIQNVICPSHAMAAHTKDVLL